ncbi:MAG TPA: prolipoprotein diacylglyceryl transferase [Burkholderiaceae bacterium]|jgi:phosphatidylglycerol---prolipoprotein diacylglyceryl transferase|nr:prolipoprotein diacylglyceryl transferase [Burkholderiaceae bacterium]
MLIHPNFDPVALQLGPIAIRWYGLMYLVAFLLFYLLGRWRLRHGHFAAASGLNVKEHEDLLFYGVLGVILGGRLGYVLFYRPDHFLQNPLEVFAVWQGGLSFHGGLLGVIVGTLIFCRMRGKEWLRVTDFFVPLIPIGLAAGRLGNFINGELWGRPGTVPWAMVFPQSGTLVPRHPSQLYQMAGEGLLLFALLWWYSRLPRPVGRVSGAFLLGYAVLRSIAELWREPDTFLGIMPLGLSMGQFLSVPMAAFGLWLLLRPAPPSVPARGAGRSAERAMHGR